MQVKARCSTGFSVTEYFGSFGVREAVDFELSSIDADKSFGFTLRNDETLEEGKTVYVQVAVMYTTIYSERRIRVFNMAFQVVKNLNQYFKACVVENWTQYFLRQKLARLHLKGARPLREEIVADTVQVLHLYRQ